MSTPESKAAEAFSSSSEITSPASPSALRFPFIADWDRYELIEPLGRGGMGSVYRARDRRIDRMVAIKFVLGADPRMTARFLREARAQSRIDHPNVCRVYEVGEVLGRPYIALQLVRGEPLHKAATQMSLDEKVAVLRDVCLAVHEAHRLGVVHRDLKPSNVLVEHIDDGRWIPIVMDFGLARELTVDTKISDAGLLLGTPAYMSPEQARGDDGAVDRRSDVYSLGATLYEITTGRVPFLESSVALLLLQLANDAPPAPRKLVPNLPVDLETIMLKCLFKDPATRYSSARALAEDLGCYLDGTPISGRRPSIWRRVYLRARQNRALVALGAGFLATLMTLVLFGIRAEIISRDALDLADRRARLAERLGGEAAKIEDSLRDAHLRPLHDIRPDRQRVRNRLFAIQLLRHNPSDPGEAYAHAALGRGHLALREWREAAAELTIARLAGLNTPDLHVALGRALGELYLHALGEAGHPVDDKDAASWLTARRTRLAREYMIPARQELEASGNGALLPKAWAALYSLDFTTAERLAREISEEDPGSSEACEIAGDAAYLAASETFDHGDHDTALPLLQRAVASYTQASLIARSDGSLYRATAEAWLQIAEIDFRRHRSPLTSLQRALDLIDHGALVSDPNDARSHSTRASILLRWYRTNTLIAPKNESAMIDSIVSSAARAVELDPGNAGSLAVLGIAYMYRGNYAFFHGDRGAVWWHRGALRLREALEITPDDPRATNALGLVHRWLGNEIDKAGGDPSSEYQAAQQYYDRSMEIDPKYFRACANQTELGALRAERKESTGEDPREAVDEARRIGQRCLVLDPSSYSVFDTLARAQLAIARYLLRSGNDPRQVLTEARRFLASSEAELPEHTEVWFQRGVAARIEATFLAQRANDPAAWIQEGRRALDKALKLMPDSAMSHVELARIDLVTRAETESPSAQLPILEDARNHADKALLLDGLLPEAHLVAADVYLAIAKARKSPVILQQGITHADEAIRLSPGSAEARKTREALDRLRDGWTVPIRP